MEEGWKICFVMVRDGFDGTIVGLDECWIEWKRVGRYACVVIVRDGLDGVISALDECWIEWKMIARYAS